MYFRVLYRLVARSLGGIPLSGVCPKNFENFSINIIETGVWWKSSPHKIQSRKVTQIRENPYQKRSIFEVRENVCFACTEEVIPSSTR